MRWCVIALETCASLSTLAVREIHVPTFQASGWIVVAREPLDEVERSRQIEAVRLSEARWPRR